MSACWMLCLPERKGSLFPWAVGRKGHSKPERSRRIDQNGAAQFLTGRRRSRLTSLGRPLLALTLWHHTLSSSQSATALCVATSESSRCLSSADYWSPINAVHG